MLPSGKIAEKHKKLMTKAETFQMLIPQNMPGAFIPQFIGKIYIKRAQKIESNYREVIHIKANKGVCLSAGGFIFNREMIQENAPKYIDGMPLGTSHDNGSGIRLGQTVGGKN
jgi:3-oxo-5alpha-steroid 4-dehydrogenase